MELTSLWRASRIPRTAKFIATAIVLCAQACGFILLYLGIKTPEAKEWATAGASISAISLPLLAVIILVTSMRSGPQEIRRATDSYLTKELPQFLDFMSEPDVDIRSRNNVRNSGEPSDTAVLTHHIPGSCVCIYNVFFNARGSRFSIIFRLEVNVRRANLCLYIDKEMIDNGTSNDFQNLQELKRLEVSNVFPHTTGGARAMGERSYIATEENIDDLDTSQTSLSNSDAYFFNSSIIERTFNNKPYYVVVAYKSLTHDFLWNYSEQAFFAQDLVIMLRSFVEERPIMFIL